MHTAPAQFCNCAVHFAKKLHRLTDCVQQWHTRKAIISYQDLQLLAIFSGLASEKQQRQIASHFANEQGCSTDARIKSDNQPK